MFIEYGRKNEHVLSFERELWIFFNKSFLFSLENRETCVYIIFDIPFMEPNDMFEKWWNDWINSIIHLLIIFSLYLQELPKAEALLSGRDLPSDNDMQSLDNNNKDAENIPSKSKVTGNADDSDSSSSSDNSFSESDEAEELNRVQIKMPLELSLSDLANAILQQNQK